MPYSKIRDYKEKELLNSKQKHLLKKRHFTLCFYSNARIKVIASFVLSKTKAKPIMGELKTRSDISLNGILFDESEDIGTISIEKMVVNFLSSISYELGRELLTLQLEMLGLSNVNIIYSNRESLNNQSNFGRVPKLLNRNFER